MMSHHHFMSPFAFRPFAPWSSPPSQLQSVMDRLFQDFETALTRPPHVARRTGPRVQIHDRGDAVTLVADVPGLLREEVELTIDGETITLRATPRARAVPEGFTPLRRERRLAALEYAFTVPYPIDAAAASATLEQGRLSVVLPKAPEAKPRRIPVKAV